MTHYKFSKSLYAVVIALVLLVLVVAINAHYQSIIQEQKTNLFLSRRSIDLYAEKNRKFPDSLDKLSEYGSKFRDEIDWCCRPMELIVKASTEHSVLDGTGGLYYDPNSGDLKVNLMKPLKSYWIFYFGEKRNDVPANW